MRSKNLDKISKEILEEVFSKLHPSSFKDLRMIHKHCIMNAMEKMWNLRGEADEHKINKLIKLEILTNHTVINAIQSNDIKQLLTKQYLLPTYQKYFLD